MVDDAQKNKECLELAHILLDVRSNIETTITCYTDHIVTLENEIKQNKIDQPKGEKIIGDVKVKIKQLEELSTKLSSEIQRITDDAVAAWRESIEEVRLKLQDINKQMKTEIEEIKKSQEDLSDIATVISLVEQTLKLLPMI